MSAQSAYNTSKADSGELVDSLLGGSDLYYVGHRACVHKSSLAERRAKIHVALGEMARRKELVDGQYRNYLHRATRNGAWLSAVSHGLNYTELSLEEFQDNLCLRYGLMPQNFPATCDGCGERLSVDLALSCTKGDLVLVRNDNAAKELGTLGSWALFPSARTYGPKINSRRVQGERNRAGAQQEGGIANGGVDTVGESGGGRIRTVNRADRLVGQPGQVVVPV